MSHGDGGTGVGRPGCGTYKYDIATTAPAKNRRLTYSLLLVTILAIICGLFCGVTTMTDWMLCETAGDCRLYQMAAYFLLALTVSSGVMFEMGVLERLYVAAGPFWAVAAPLIACAAFMVVGPALMLLNKHIMEERSFPYPLSLSALGLLASAAFAHIVVGMGLVEIQAQSYEELAGMRYARIVLPIAACRAITLATGNAVYLHLSMGFIQMLKAFMPAVVLAVACFSTVDKPARSAVWCVMVIVAGTLIEVQGELHATTLGLTLMLVSCVGEAICVVMSQRLLQNLKFTVVESMYFLSLPSVAFLLVPAAILEWKMMFEAGHHLKLLQYPTEMFGAAALGVLVNFLGFYVVQLTSSVFMKILNTVRCIGLVLVGSMFYGEEHSMRQISGYAVSLVGFLGYTYFQRRHDRAAAVEAWADGQLDRARACVKRSSFPSDREFGEGTVPGDMENGRSRTLIDANGCA